MSGNSQRSGTQATHFTTDPGLLPELGASQLTPTYPLQLLFARNPILGLPFVR